MQWACARLIWPVDSGKSGVRCMFLASRFIWDGAVVLQIDYGSGSPFCAVHLRETLWCSTDVWFLPEDSEKCTW